jgi:hypothetical protein
MKICPVGAELFHAGERTEGRRGRHDEAFVNSANAPKHTGSTAIKNGLQSLVQGQIC